MFFSRMIQFNRAMISILKGMDKESEKFIHKYLDNKELDIFNMMCKFDKLHCIRVARDVEDYVYKMNTKIDNKDKLIKIALLHDIGKSKAKYHIFHRVIFVLIRKIYCKKNGKFHWEKADIYYNHAEIGYEILKKYGFDGETLFLVKNHHNNFINDERLKVLIKCDEKN